MFEAVAYLINGPFESLSRWWGEHPDMEAGALAELCTDVLFPGLVTAGRIP
jgi:hypothetical protein